MVGNGWMDGDQNLQQAPKRWNLHLAITLFQNLRRSSSQETDLWKHFRNKALSLFRYFTVCYPQICPPHFLQMHLKCKYAAEKKMLCALKQKCKTILDLFNAKGGITLWQNFHLWESWLSPWAIFFWKYRFEVYCFCLSGTIFHRDPS